MAWQLWAGNLTRICYAYKPDQSTIDIYILIARQCDYKQTNSLSIFVFHSLTFSGKFKTLFLSFSFILSLCLLVQFFANKVLFPSLLSSFLSLFSNLISLFVCLQWDVKYSDISDWSPFHFFSFGILITFF